MWWNVNRSNHRIIKFLFYEQLNSRKMSDVLYDEKAICKAKEVRVDIPAVRPALHVTETLATTRGLEGIKWMWEKRA